MHFENTTLHFLFIELINTIKSFCFRALSESLISPLELKMEEWKKVASQLDKDHAKGIPTCFLPTHTHPHTHAPTHCRIVLV